MRGFKKKRPKKFKWWFHLNMTKKRIHDMKKNSFGLVLMAILENFLYRKFKGTVTKFHKLHSIWVPCEMALYVGGVIQSPRLYMNLYIKYRLTRGIHCEIWKNSWINPLQTPVACMVCLSVCLSHRMVLGKLIICKGPKPVTFKLFF